MARPPKPEYASNPLRLLRGFLTEKGNAPITQNELSEIIDVPVNTIRAIEAGQRNLTNEVLSKVTWGTRAQWVKGQWVDLLNKETPFSFEVFSEFLEMRNQPMDAEKFVKLQKQLLILLALIPDDEQWNLQLRIEDFLGKCWEDFGLQEYFKLKEAKTLFNRIIKGAPPPGDNRTAELKRIYQQKVKQIKQRRRKKEARLTGSNS